MDFEKIEDFKSTKYFRSWLWIWEKYKIFIEQGYAPENIFGIDISSNMIRKAKKYIQNNKVLLQTSPVNKIPFKTDTFDVVFVHGVFMHVKPKDLEASFAEVIRVCKKYIICVEQNKNGNEYTFIHNYKKLFSNRNIKVIEYKKKNELELDFIYAKVRKK